jgi:hypothetical protein
MHCLLLLPSYKLLRKPTPIALGDKCPRKLAFVGIKPSRTIIVVENMNRKLMLLPNNYARKLTPSLESHFLVMGVQKN